MQTATLDINKIKKYFPFHRICVVKTFILLAHCIILSGSTNLNKVKKKAGYALGEIVEPATAYTRFIRFFKIKDTVVFSICILRLIQSLLSDFISKQGEYLLSIDRTNWKLGKININLLTIGLVLNNGRFIPIYFELLGKQGNSSQNERKELLAVLHTIFEMKKPIILVGDREFIGKDWFDHLKKSIYEFAIRIRKGDYKGDLAKQLGISEAELDKKIAKKVLKKGYYVSLVEIEGKTYYYHVKLKAKKDDISKTDKDKYIRFISTSSDTEWVVNVYHKRWKIEVFFEDIKQKSFNLEDLNFTDLEKIRLMVAVTSFCYALCLKEGLIEYKERSIPEKKDKHSGKLYPRTSIFTKGCENIEKALLTLPKMITLIVSFLEDTFDTSCRF